MKLLVATCILVFVSGLVVAQSQRDTLKGLTGVKVDIELTRDNEKFTAAQLQSDTETRLRKAGIRVLEKSEHSLKI